MASHEAAVPIAHQTHAMTSIPMAQPITEKHVVFSQPPSQPQAHTFPPQVQHQNPPPHGMADYNQGQYIHTNYPGPTHVMPTGDSFDPQTGQYYSYPAQAMPVHSQMGPQLVHSQSGYSQSQPSFQGPSQTGGQLLHTHSGGIPQGVPMPGQHAVQYCHAVPSGGQFHPHAAPPPVHMVPCYGHNIVPPQSVPHTQQGGAPQQTGHGPNQPAGGPANPAAGQQTNKEKFSDMAGAAMKKAKVLLEKKAKPGANGNGKTTHYGDDNGGYSQEDLRLAAAANCAHPPEYLTEEPTGLAWMCCCLWLLTGNEAPCTQKRCTLCDTVFD